MREWGGYLWLTIVALCASAFRWRDIAKDQDGNPRWGLLILQLPTAFAISVVAHAAAPAVIYWFPYSGSFVAEGLAGIFAFAGPLVVTRIFDAVSDGLRKRIGGPG